MGFGCWGVGGRIDPLAGRAGFAFAAGYRGADRNSGRAGAAWPGTGLAGSGPFLDRHRRGGAGFRSALGWLAFATVQFQGLLGGLRVVLFKDDLGILHAALAQIFLVLVCAIALLT